MAPEARPRDSAGWRRNSVSFMVSFCSSTKRRVVIFCRTPGDGDRVREHPAGDGGGVRERPAGDGGGVREHPAGDGGESANVCAQFVEVRSEIALVRSDLGTRIEEVRSELGAQMRVLHEDVSRTASHGCRTARTRCVRNPCVRDRRADAPRRRGCPPGISPLSTP